MSFPNPLSLDASQYWEGPDGSWSSFWFGIGTPAQYVRLLPATGYPATYVVDASRCKPRASGELCPLRGDAFSYWNSTTWKSQGLYTLNLDDNLLVANNTAGFYGLESIAFGLPSNSSNNLVFTNQVVVSIEVDDYYIGQLGLSAQKYNISDFSTPIDSLTATLFVQKQIPSLSWAYTAGARHRGISAYGSLVYGGYDQAKFAAGSGLTFNLTPDVSRDTVVSLHSITTIIDSVNRTLLPSGIDNVFVESTTTYIWLPIEACDLFQELFGLEFDETHELYLMNDTMHARFENMDVRVTFHIMQDLSNIALPYEALALYETRPWFYKNPTRYFAIKRATGPSQYTLGRAFLQEAYLIVDYGRNNFSLQQTTFDNPISSTIVSIDPVEVNLPHHRSLSSTLILGIVLPALFACTMLSVWIWLRVQKIRVGKGVGEIKVGEGAHNGNSHEHMTRSSTKTSVSPDIEIVPQGP